MIHVVESSMRTYGGHNQTKSRLLCYFSFYLVGPPLPLFSLKNGDVSNHEVVIEIFDLHDKYKSIFKEKLELDPKEEICYPILD